MIRQILREFLKRTQKAKDAKNEDFYADFIEQLIDDKRVILGRRRPCYQVR